MNENAMMKKIGRNRTKAAIQEKVKPATKKAMGGKVAGYAKGGAVGCEIKGKTKGTMIKMAKGGKTC